MVDALNGFWMYHVYVRYHQVGVWLVAAKRRCNGCYFVVTSDDYTRGLECLLLSMRDYEVELGRFTIGGV